jgi:hypothetical protein
MMRSPAIVRRNHPARHRGWHERAAAHEEQQHPARARVERLEAGRIARHRLQPKLVAVECDSPRQIVGLQDRFEHTMDGVSGVRIHAAKIPATVRPASAFEE